MDYLVFLTGLFLLFSSLGCLLLTKQDWRLSRWPALALGLAALGLRVWLGIASYGIGLEINPVLMHSLLCSLFAAALLTFSLSRSGKENKRSLIAKVMLIATVFGIVFVSGADGKSSPFHVIPIVATALGAGWKLSRLRLEYSDIKSPFLSIAFPALLGIVAGCSQIHHVVELVFDLNGMGNSPTRLALLGLIGLGTAAAASFCFILWSEIGHSNRSKLSSSLSRRRRIAAVSLFIAAVFTAINGAWLAHWLGTQAREEQKKTLLSALHLGAHNIPAEKVTAMKGEETEIFTPNYEALREKLLQIREAFPRSRFVYILGMRGERLVFLVDAEDPSNVDTFSKPGDPVEDYPEKWQPELGGKATLVGPDRDDWGVWFAATVPILDDEQRVVGLLGVDWPARDWLKPTASRRLAAMGVTLSVALLLITLFCFQLISIETERKLENLSERLTDAMTAAEFDTWECFLNPFTIHFGERIAAILGWHPTDGKPAFRKLWQSIHAEDRKQLLNLIRKKGSLEAEIRLLDRNGQWLWFMLRGRIVNPVARDVPTRLVGTILNIDEAHRSRLEIDKQRRFAQHVMNSVPNGLAIINAEGNVTYANPAFIRLIRSSETDLVGTPLDSLLTGKANGTSKDGFDATLTCMDQEKIPVRAFMASLTDSGVNAVSILALIDLTAAKEAEQNLLRSRAEANRLALVAKRTDNAVVITDASGVIEWVNEGFTKISGYTKDEVIGRKPGSILQRQDENNEARQYMGTCIRAGKGFESEIVNYSKSGRSYIVHIECQPLLDRNGNLTGFMAIERDITQMRRSSRLLEAVATTSSMLLSRDMESEAWNDILAALGGAANADRCYLFNIHTHPQLGTPAMSQCAEWNSGAATPQMPNPVFQNMPFYESDYGRWYEELSKDHEITGLLASFPALEQPMLIAQEIRSLVVVPVHAGEKLTGFLGFDACHEDRIWESWEISILRSAAANIGLRQVAQQERDALVVARDEARHAAINAERANQAKSTFLATMSHEIRTPLNAVIGMASLLETTSLNSQQKDFAETILNSSNFLLELINDILDYSRIETSKIDLDEHPFCLSETCRDAFDMVRSAAAGKSIEFIARIDPMVPDRLIGDRARIRQILVNLLGNAVKFTHEGFVHLTVTGKEASRGRWEIELNLEDSGIGISSDGIAKLFRPFVQEDSSTTRRFGGSGLGLAISKRLAEFMDGDITVTSTQGKGSRFTVRLALRPAPLEGSIPKPFVSANRHPSILIVDDNELNRRILEEILASWGMPCDPASSAKEAVELWSQRGPYDLVFTDHQMPEMDGAEMTRVIRGMNGGVDCRFCLASSDTYHSSQVRTLFEAVISKPIWPATIHETLSRLFPEAMPSETPSPSRPDDSNAELPPDLKVLVAEDNPNNQKVISLLLRRIGVEAVMTSNGKEAVTAAAATDYDVILLDIQMPVMDGLEASRIIRGMKPAKRPHILAISANVFQEDRDAALAAGMDDYLAKPITLGKLRSKLAEMAMKLGQQAAAKPAPEVHSNESAESVTRLLDLQMLENLSFLGREGCTELIEDATRESSQHLAQIRDAIVSGQSQRLKELLHKLRGMLLQIGAHALPQRLHEIEQEVNTISPESAASLHSELDTLWNATRAALLQQADSFPSSE
jgi:PAS domain S-box-containing protein